MIIPGAGYIVHGALETFNLNKVLRLRVLNIETLSV